MAIVDESLYLAHKVRHHRGHLHLLLGVEHATQMDRSDLHGAVSAEDCVGYTGVKIGQQEEKRDEKSGAQRRRVSEINCS